MRRDLWLLAPLVLLAWRLEVGPDVYDAGELAAAAAALGASHPPGQPLHALLGHAVSLVPLGSIPFRLAAASLAGELAAAWLVFRLARIACEGGGRASAIAPYAAAACALLAPPLLRQAVRVEVYGPALALSLYGVHEALGALSRKPGALARACLIAGLVAFLHPPHAVAPLGTVALVALAERGSHLHARGVVLCAALLGVGALSVLYLPLRARAGALVWGDPTTLDGLWSYVSASAYRQNLATRAGATPLAWLAYAVRASGALPALGLLVAWAPRSLRGGEPTPRALLLLSIAGPLALVAAMVQPIEERNPDNVAYAAPAVALIVAAGAAALGRALDAARPAVAGAALVVLAANPLALAEARTHTDAATPALETLAAVLAESPPTRALVVVETDFVASALMSAQAIDGARPDVALFVTGLATSSWHWSTLAAHPAFDGRPVRGPGASPRDAYPRGAVRSASGRVPVAVEPAWLEPAGASVVGVLAVHPAVDEPASTRAALAHATDEAARAPLGDADVAGAVVRHAVLGRAGRLAGRDRPAEALRWLERLAFFLEPSERGLLRAEPTGPRRPLAPLVRDPGAFLTSQGDVVRAAAIVLASRGARGPAIELLEARGDAGDPYAWLEAAAILHVDGDRDAAARAADRALALDPALAPQARAILDSRRSAP